MIFAIAAKSFDKPSETFIRRHATDLAPGRTVLLLRDEPRSDHVPSIAHLRYYQPRLGRRNGLMRALRVARFLKAHNVGPILAEYGPVGVELMWAARLAGCDLHVHFHGYDATSSLRRPRMVRRYQRLFRRCKSVFVPSDFIGRKLSRIGCDPAKITVTPCGVDPERFPRSIRRPGRVLSVGRFVEKKAPLRTLEAFVQVAQNNSGLHLDFVGDGPLLEPGRAFVAARGLADRVTFHGAQSHDVVRDLMAQASIYLQHSVTSPDGDMEGLPVSILEAMCSGLAVISTRHSGIPEAVIHAESGLLVEEHDATGMAQALERVVSDDALRVRLSDAARERVIADFTAERSLGILRRRMGLEARD